jgi:hypothetical protein
MTTQKGTHITNIDSTPPTVVDGRLHGGVVKYYGDQFELTDTANADDAIVLKLPIDAIAKHIYFACDDLGTAGTIDIGFHLKNTDGTYTAVDADAFADNIDVNAAAVTRTDYRFSAKGIETANQTLWELAGLSARPAYDDIYLSVTTDTGTTADGTVLLQAELSV